MKTEDLLGAWRLHLFRIRFEDNRPAIFPFGEDAQGQLIYTADGHMSAFLSQRIREPLSSKRLETSGSSTDGEKSAAFDSFLSYCGRFSVDGDEVTHHVELALVPNIAGLDQIRNGRIDGDQLFLDYELTPKSGVTRHYELIWQRP